MPIGTILKLALPIAKVIATKAMIKYSRELKKLEEKRDEILDAPQVDRNKLGHVDRDILRLGNLVALEIQRS